MALGVSVLAFRSSRYCKWRPFRRQAPDMGDHWLCLCGRGFHLLQHDYSATRWMYVSILFCKVLLDNALTAACSDRILWEKNHGGSKAEVRQRKGVQRMFSNLMLIQIAVTFGLLYTLGNGFSRMRMCSKCLDTTASLTKEGTLYLDSDILDGLGLVLGPDADYVNVCWYSKTHWYEITMCLCKSSVTRKMLAETSSQHFFLTKYTTDFVFLPSLFYVIRPSNRTWQKAGYDVEATKPTTSSTTSATANPMSTATSEKNTYKL